MKKSIISICLLLLLMTSGLVYGSNQDNSLLGIMSETGSPDDYLNLLSLKEELESQGFELPLEFVKKSSELSSSDLEHSFLVAIYDSDAIIYTAGEISNESKLLGSAIGNQLIAMEIDFTEKNMPVDDSQIEKDIEALSEESYSKQTILGVVLDDSSIDDYQMIMSLKSKLVEQNFNIDFESILNSDVHESHLDNNLIIFVNDKDALIFTRLEIEDDTTQIIEELIAKEFKDAEISYEFLSTPFKLNQFNYELQKFIDFECFDSDNGIDFFNQGYVLQEGKKLEEKCLNNDELIEYYCDNKGKIQSEKYSCEIACLEGECIKELVEEKLLLGIMSETGSPDDYLNLLSLKEELESQGFELPLEFVKKSSELSSSDLEHSFLVAIYGNDAIIYTTGDSSNEAKLLGSAIGNQLITMEIDFTEKNMPVDDSQIEKDLDYLPKEESQEIEANSVEKINDSLCQGCSNVDGACFPVGTRINVNESIQYCSINYVFKELLKEGQPCLNNYECESNSCNNNQCYNLVDEMNKTQSLIEKLFAWLSSIFN